MLRFGTRRVPRALRGLATVGIDDIYGAVRYDFGTDLLRDGINYLAILVGVYALTEALTRFSQRFGGKVAQQPTSVRTTLPGLSAIRDRSGSFVLQSTGSYDGTAATDTSSVVPGSGNGDLRGLRGTGGSVATHEQVSLELDYDLA